MAFTLEHPPAVNRGTYHARLVGWRELSGSTLWWEFALETGRSQPLVLGFETGRCVEPGLRAAAVLEAFGIPIPKTESEARRIDPDALVGRTCTVTVQHWHESINGLAEAVITGVGPG